LNHLHATLLAGCVAAVGCITVNINFPPKEVEKAAEVIVAEARPDGGGGDGAPAPDAAPGEGSSGTSTEAPPPPPPVPEPAPPPAPPEEKAGDPSAPKGQAAREEPGARAGEAGHFLLAAFPAAAAGEEKKESPPPSDIKINIETPVIKKIRESLNARGSKLVPFYDKGPIGEAYNGYCEIRDESKLGIAEKRDLRLLVAEENKDRKNLYLEIVKENHFDDSHLKDVERIFAIKWAEKSRTGWWIQGKYGKWMKKPPPPRDEKGAGKKA
jgi:uncharacterized protein